VCAGYDDDGYDDGAGCRLFDDYLMRICFCLVEILIQGDGVERAGIIIGQHAGRGENVRAVVEVYGEGGKGRGEEEAAQREGMMRGGVGERMGLGEEREEEL